MGPAARSSRSGASRQLSRERTTTAEAFERLVPGRDTERLEQKAGCACWAGYDETVDHSGVNMPTPAVAAQAAEHPDVADTAVVEATEGEKWGTVMAFVVADLDRQGRSRVGRRGPPQSWAPREVVVVDTLPLLSNGKLDRLELQAQQGGAASRSRRSRSRPASAASPFARAYY